MAVKWQLLSIQVATLFRMSPFFCVLLEEKRSKRKRRVEDASMASKIPHKRALLKLDNLVKVL